MTETKPKVDRKELFRRIATGELRDEWCRIIHTAWVAGRTSLPEIIEQALAGLGIDVLTFLQQAPLLLDETSSLPEMGFQEGTRATVGLLQESALGITGKVTSDAIERGEFDSIVQRGLIGFLDRLLVKAGEPGSPIPETLGVLRAIRTVPGVTLKDSGIEDILQMASV